MNTHIGRPKGLLIPLQRNSERDAAVTKRLQDIPYPLTEGGVKMVPFSH